MALSQNNQIRISGDGTLDTAMLVFMCAEVENQHSFFRWEKLSLWNIKGFVQGHQIDYTYTQAVSRTQTSYSQSRALTPPGSLIYRNYNFCRMITLSFIWCHLISARPLSSRFEIEKVHWESDQPKNKVLKDTDYEFPNETIEPDHPRVMFIADKPLLHVTLKSICSKFISCKENPHVRDSDQDKPA